MDPFHSEAMQANREPGAHAPSGGASYLAREIVSAHPRVFAYASLMTGSREEANQCLRLGYQAAMRKAASIGTVRPEVFVMRIVRERVLDAVRPRPMATARDAKTTGAEFRAAIQKRDKETVADLVFQALQGMPFDEREVFVLSVVLGYTPALSEQITGDHVPMLQARLFRACEQMDGWFGHQESPDAGHAE